MNRRRHGRHDWLGLTPEVERLAPALAATVAGALGEDDGAYAAGAVDALVRDGDAEAWLEHLAALGALVERARAEGVAPAETAILAGILRDQYRLAPGVLHLRPHDEARSTRMEEITA